MAETFSDALRALRTERHLSQRALAALAHVDSGHLSRIEAGTRPPSAAFAAAVDAALNADGQLVAYALDAADLAARESARLSDMLCGRPGTEVIHTLENGTRRLAVEYLTAAPAAMMHGSGELRRAAMRALQRKTVNRPAAVTDVTLYAGYTSGVLAYGALDLGDPGCALIHAQAAWDAADAAGSNQLRAWVRGTQSLVTRFAGDYTRALAYAADGLAYADTGTARTRLLCGVAQCHANMADANGARGALDAAATAREQEKGVDDMPGLFAFSAAKQAYYSGSTLIWLDGKADARRALAEAERALTLWGAADPLNRPQDDLALAHVYAATACLLLGELDRAVDWLAPILDLPADRRSSWIRKRMARVDGMLAAPPFAGDAVAVDTRHRISALAG